MTTLTPQRERQLDPITFEVLRRSFDYALFAPGLTGFPEDLNEVVLRVADEEADRAAVVVRIRDCDAYVAGAVVVRGELASCSNSESDMSRLRVGEEHELVVSLGGVPAELYFVPGERVVGLAHDLQVKETR